MPRTKINTSPKSKKYRNFNMDLDDLMGLDYFNNRNNSNNNNTSNT